MRDYFRLGQLKAIVAIIIIAVIEAKVIEDFEEVDFKVENEVKEHSKVAVKTVGSKICYNRCYFLNYPILKDHWMRFL